MSQQPPFKVQTNNKGLFQTMGDFLYQSKLGTGSFGNVNLYTHKLTGKKYAVKIIPCDSITSQYEAEGIEREIRVHAKCTHPNIIQFHDAFLENNNIYMVLEYVENGNLFSHIQKNPPMSEQEACKYFAQTCLALQYMHCNNIFHRDIKPENLLLDEQMNIKLCDFGWCAENIHQKRKTFCGTYEYMAPEIVLEMPYDFRIDIWSVGILLYELLHKCAPFKGKDYKEIADSIKQCQPKVKAHVSKEALGVILNLLQLDPLQRLSFLQIFQTPLVRKHFPGMAQTQPQSGSGSVQVVSTAQPHSTQSQSQGQASTSGQQAHLGVQQAQILTHHSIHQQENIKPKSPQRQFKLGSPRRRITEYTGQIIKLETKGRLNSPKLIEKLSPSSGMQQHQSQQTQKMYVSPSRRVLPKGRNLQGAIDLRGKDATKIVYMNLCNNY